MTSPRQRPDRPVRSVVLKITFRARKEEAAKIRAAIPSAVMRAGQCRIRIEAEEPTEAAEKARALLEKLRAIA